MARYLISPERSRVSIDAKSNVHPIHAGTTGLTGRIDLEIGPNGQVDTASPASGQFSLPVSLLSSGNRMEDRELTKRLDARRYPSIDGVLENLEPDAASGSYRARFGLTCRGVSRQHDGVVNVTRIDDHTIELTGTARFDVREFGIEPPRVLMLKVEPEIDVRVDILAVSEP